MRGDPGNSSTLHKGEDVPQFAPNFTVYVLPPDVVCLYSEDRKFFLHGELYCSLAAAVGEGGKSFRQLARELGRRFPPDKIQEALKRLVERRYVVPRSRSSGDAVAAYWASLGLLPEDAQRNLHKCCVRIQSIDVKGAKELSDALTTLGVRVVKRSADLTVMLVSD
jgi:oxazoline/thiazoline synthase